MSGAFGQSSGGGGGSWGSITGTIGSQTDLSTALGNRLLSANNLSDLVTPSTARTNLGLAIGTNVQAFNANLTTLAGLALTSGNLIRANGTAWQSTTLVASDIPNLTVSKISDIATNYQPLNARLTDITSAFAGATNGFAIRKNAAGTALEFFSASSSTVTYPGRLPTLTWASTTTVTFSAGDAVIAGNMVTNGANFTKSLSTWAAGSGNGGLATGTVANNTTYHAFILRKTSDSTVDFMFDTSVTGANVPSGYTARAIGAIRTDGSSTIRKFYQLDNDFIWDVPPTDYSGTWANTATLTTLTTPTGLECVAILNVHSGLPALSNSSEGWVRYPGSADYAPAYVGAGVDFASYYSSTTLYMQNVQLRVRTNTANQVRFRVNNLAASANGSIQTIGFVYPR